MSSSINNHIQSELETLKKDINAYLNTELHYILQPEYRKLNKARTMVDALLKLVGSIEHLIQSPQSVHDTALDEGLKMQSSVIQQLEKDYPQSENQQALQGAQQHLNAVFAIIKQLRTEVPRAVTEQAASPKKPTH